MPKLSVPKKSATQFGGKKPPMAKKGTMKRLLNMLFSKNRGHLIAVIICILISGTTGVASSVFLTWLLNTIAEGLNVGYGAVAGELVKIFITMGIVYSVNLICTFTYTRLMAVITQNFLHQIRTALFNKMEVLPVKFFDSNKTGDLMSVFANDTDALRQLVSQSIPHLVAASVSVITLLVIMLRFSIWLSLVIFFGVFLMFIVTKKVGGNSAKYFIKRQRALGIEEGYVEEMMRGQKVVKVFCHEEESKNGFDERNDELCDSSNTAQTFANILMPIMGNLGNILYVLVAFVGGLLVALGVQNLTITGFEPIVDANGFVSFIITIMAFLP
ncbi:MAG: ABC transporter ATP-binding protein, partial [Clostridia bacterium]|nr:ABC transporter ATP-binding protein [Clostridia bacterium]